MTAAGTRARAIVAGNWKMNGSTRDLAAISAIAEGVGSGDPEVILCPPATLIAEAARLTRATGVIIGGQDCHAAPAGPHTGDVSAEMLADAGARAVILGHSERRADHDEDDALIGQKLAAARRTGLLAILCVGETEAQRAEGRALDVATGQLRAAIEVATPDPQRFVLAYEPVWAIGSGRVPSAADIGEMHGALRTALVSGLPEGGAAVPILYGGSVKSSNAAEIFAVDGVNGALVGGASLTAEQFLPIVAALGR